MTNEHRAPWDYVYAKETDSVCRPGTKPASDREYFEILCLRLLQAGLNWNSIRRHWAKYKSGFEDFDIERLAQTQAANVPENPNALKNRRKIEAVIHNANEFRGIAGAFGSFGAYLETLKNQPENEQLRAFAKRFKQVAPETADYFLHAVGFWS
ncbi:MAG TPA: DNA-3-methyladenine glycosylase I [Pyrinomonadaceae bacterium]|jgi:DNA-3-methyladenine glycosylase I